MQLYIKLSDVTLSLLTTQSIEYREIPKLFSSLQWWCIQGFGESVYIFAIKRKFTFLIQPGHFHKDLYSFSQQSGSYSQVLKLGAMGTWPLPLWILLTFMKSQRICVTITG